MFVLNDDLSIHATRGDTVFFKVNATEDGVPYLFKGGDVLRIKVFAKKNCESVVLQKDFGIYEDTDCVDIVLSGTDTKFGGVISKPTDYWYEVELNPWSAPMTIIGHDEEGAKIFRLYPEGADITTYEPEPEEIPVVDDKLDLTSERPVANRVIARAIYAMTAEDVKALPITGGMLEGDLYIRRVLGNGSAAIGKNHSAIVDYGFQIVDNDKDGNMVRLSISGKDQSFTFRTKDNVVHDVYGGHNVEDLREQAGLRMRDYTDLAQLGLTEGAETVEQIAMALPIYSRLTLAVGQNGNASAYPDGNIGLLVVEKATQSRIKFTFTSNQAEMWVGMYAINSTGNTWTGWIEH